MKTMDFLKGVSISKDGPIQITLPYIHCSDCLDFFSEDYKAYTIYIKCEDMIEFPLDGNPRYVDENSSNFKKNYNTLTTMPQIKSMQDNQLGGDIFTNFLNIDRDNKSVTFTFESTEMGVINGGTTMGACLKAKFLGSLKSGHILCFRVRDYNKAQLSYKVRLKCVENAISLNNVKPQKTENLCLQKGFFDDIYKNLNRKNKELICLRNGVNQYTKNEKFDGSILIRLLESWDIRNYPSGSKCPQKVNNNYKKIIETFESKMDNGLKPFDYLLPLLNDMIEFYGFILYNWDSELIELVEKEPRYLETLNNLQSRRKGKDKDKDKETFTVITSPLKTPFNCNYPNEYSRRGGIRAESFVWAIFSSFRANITYNSDSDELYYRVPLKDLWGACNVDLLKKVEKGLIFDCKGAVTEFVKQDSVWADLYEVVDSAVRRLEKC